MEAALLFFNTVFLLYKHFLYCCCHCPPIQHSRPKQHFCLVHHRHSEALFSSHPPYPLTHLSLTSDLENVHYEYAESPWQAPANPLGPRPPPLGSLVLAAASWSPLHFIFTAACFSVLCPFSLLSHRSPWASWISLRLVTHPKISSRNRAPFPACDQPVLQTQSQAVTLTSFCCCYCLGRISSPPEVPILLSCAFFFFKHCQDQFYYRHIGLVKEALLHERGPGGSTSLWSWRDPVSSPNKLQCMHDQSLQLCPTLCDPTDCSPPGSSVLGMPQARILEWVSMPSSRRCSWPRNRTRVSCVSRIAGGFSTAEPPTKPNQLQQEMKSLWRVI